MDFDLFQGVQDDTPLFFAVEVSFRVYSGNVTKNAFIGCKCYLLGVKPRSSHAPIGLL